MTIDLEGGATAPGFVEGDIDIRNAGRDQRQQRRDGLRRRHQRRRQRRDPHPHYLGTLNINSGGNLYLEDLPLPGPATPVRGGRVRQPVQRQRGQHAHSRAGRAGAGPRGARPSGNLRQQRDVGGNPGAEARPAAVPRHPGVHDRRHQPRLDERHDRYGGAQHRRRDHRAVHRLGECHPAVCSVGRGGDLPDAGRRRC